MDINKLNPYIRSASLYEKTWKSGECVAYDCRVIFMLSGDISISVGKEKASHLTSGQIIYIPAGTPYKIKGQYLRAAVITFDLTDSFSHLEDRIPPVPVAEFCPEKCHSTEGFSPFDKAIRLDDIDTERDTFLRMCNIFTTAEGNYRAVLSAMFKLILLKIAESKDENALPARMVEGLDNYIRDNVGEEISNTEIGAIFGYHPFYISKMLKDKKGQTLRQYIIVYRLKLAKRLLELTAKSINEIAEECGFTDASYFAKTFKASFGITPKEYRNKFKEDYI